MSHEYAFEMATSNIRFGIGVTREVGMDLADLGVRRALVVTDPNLVKLAPVATVLESLRREKIEFAVFDRVHVEPTDRSFQEAIDAARFFLYDGILEVEAGVPDAARAGLTIKGHQVVASDSPWGGGQGIVIDWDRGVLQGGSDPRKDGNAAGY